MDRRAGRAAGGRRDARPGRGDGAARPRLPLVEPGARGLGIGDRLVRTVTGFAREAGSREAARWTDDVLTAARRVHERHGFVPAAGAPRHPPGRDPVGQDRRPDPDATPA
ncbi:GNAT family N-acetyltransferase [Streptomyces sp. NPDC085946]|uniref:GNAT family N-acetyltransferase n=1 Tax=Streptomyces sp. NPDC085946 TaxID=3365744 RepID=UPI0037D224E3